MIVAAWGGKGAVGLRLVGPTTAMHRKQGPLPPDPFMRWRVVLRLEGKAVLQFWWAQP